MRGTPREGCQWSTGEGRGGEEGGNGRSSRNPGSSNSSSSLFSSSRSPLCSLLHN